MSDDSLSLRAGSRAAALWGIFFAGFLIFLPFLSVAVPRFLAYGPALCGVIALLVWPRVFGPWPRLSRLPFIVMGSFAALAVVSSLWAVDPGDAIGRALRTGLVLMSGALVIALAQAAPLQTIERWLKYLPAVLAVSVILLTLESSFHYPVYRLIHSWPEAQRLSGSYMNRNVTVIILCCFAALPLARLWHRLGPALLLALCFPLIGMTDSQAVQLAFFVGCAFLFLFPRRFEVLWILLAVFVAGLIFAAPWLAPWMYGFADELHLMPVVGKGGGWASDRLEIWDFVARRALENPLYGFGFEATRMMDDFDGPMIYHKSTSVLHPHNFALQLWIEFGVIGAAAGAALFAFLLHRIYKFFPAETQRPALAVLMMALTVAAMTYGIWQGWWLGFLGLLTVFCTLSARVAGAKKQAAN